MAPLLSMLLLLCALPLAAAEFPWSLGVPEALVQEAVQPDRVAQEAPCDWRPVLTPMAEALVRDCGSAREAVLALATGLPKATGVYYSPERRKPAMNVAEALAEKKVSCTGQSILLVCALRSVGIPARMVGLLTWNHVPGNHSWAEAWFEGEWHMIEYAERDFNTPWVMENIGMLDPQNPLQRIQALTPAGDTLFLPAYAMDRQELPAVDVTERYAALARAWYVRAGVTSHEQRLLVDCEARPSGPLSVRVETEDGELISEALLPSLQDDVRRMARLLLPREGCYYLRLEGSAERRPLKATPAPVQILRLSL